MNEEIITPGAQVDNPLPTLPLEPITPLMLLHQAMQNKASTEVLQQFLDMQKRWENDEKERQFNTAFAAAKAELPVLEKNRTVEFEAKQGGRKTSYKHADLGEIVGTITPILAKHGLWHRFEQTSEPNEPISVSVIIGHSNGHTIQSKPLRAGRDSSMHMNSYQQLGSALTYLQRYALLGALGLASAEDDDASMISYAPITAGEAAELQKQIEDAGTTVERFKKRWRVDALAHLPKEQLQNALDDLQKYKLDHQKAS